MEQWRALTGQARKEARGSLVFLFGLVAYVTFAVSSVIRNVDTQWWWVNLALNLIDRLAYAAALIAALLFGGVLVLKAVNDDRQPKNQRYRNASLA